MGRILPWPAAIWLVLVMPKMIAVSRTLWGEWEKSAFSHQLSAASARKRRELKGMMGGLMERFFELSGVTLVTLCSMGLALLIEVGLLKLIFHCLARVRVEAVEDCGTAVGRQWVGRAARVGEISRQPSALSRQ